VEGALEGEPLRLAGLRMTAGGVPRHGYPVLAGGRPCGEVTSGMYAPSLEEFLAMAYLPPALCVAGTDVAVEIRGRAHPAVVVPRPFYRPAYRR
jgi:aminomethyltransferase